MSVWWFGELIIRVRHTGWWEQILSTEEEVDEEEEAEQEEF